MQAAVVVCRYKSMLSRFGSRMFCDDDASGQKRITACDCVECLAVGFRIVIRRIKKNKIQSAARCANKVRSILADNRGAIRADS
jgi:hypothetical protein